jgi:hypothetical protein
MPPPIELSTTSASDEFFPFQRDALTQHWPLIEPHLRRFEHETRTTSAETILAQAQNAEAQVWGYQRGGDLRGVCVTRVHEHARGRYCTVWVLVGTFDGRLRAGLDILESWARSLGCVSMEVIGRPGWARVLHDYRPRALVLEKSLRALH